MSPFAQANVYNLMGPSDRVLPYCCMTELLLSSENEELDAAIPDPT